MKLTIEDLTFEELQDDDEWHGPINMRKLLREAVVEECRKVARSVAADMVAEKRAEIAAEMRSWLAGATPAELARLGS